MKWQILFLVLLCIYQVYTTPQDTSGNPKPPRITQTGAKEIVEEEPKGSGPKHPRMIQTGSVGRSRNYI